MLVARALRLKTTLNMEKSGATGFSSLLITITTRTSLEVSIISWIQPTLHFVLDLPDIMFQLRHAREIAFYVSTTWAFPDM